MKFKEIPSNLGLNDTMDDIRKMGKQGKEVKRLWKKEKMQTAETVYRHLKYSAFMLSWGDELLEHAENKTFLKKLGDFLNGINTASPEALKKRRTQEEATLQDLFTKLGMQKPLPKTPEERRALYEDIKKGKKELTELIYTKLKPKLKSPGNMGLELS